jgi:hypothetical protein
MTWSTGTFPHAVAWGVAGAVSVAGAASLMGRQVCALEVGVPVGDSRTLTTGTPLLWSFGGRAESALAVGQWQVCTGPNYSGQCEIIAGNVDLADWGLANRIFSARPR